MTISKRSLPSSPTSITPTTILYVSQLPTPPPTLRSSSGARDLRARTTTWPPLPHAELCQASGERAVNAKCRATS